VTGRDAGSHRTPLHGHGNTRDSGIRYISGNPFGSPSIIVSYKGFTITPRTFQIRGTGRWTLDLSICGPKGLRVFSGPLTYPNEQAAITGCSDLGRRIIDGRSEEGSVEDLV
jgi:hypothetical protein